jgi:pimeloyl-ACP methyl ester carboxylesterase
MKLNMRIIYLIICCSFFVFQGCSSNKDNAGNEPIVIEEQGSFAIGGKILRNENGNTFHGDHGYVFYQLPVNARKYPLVFAHGVGQFSKTWETTPDGREGFQNIFLRRGFGVYLVDQPRRGNAGRGTETVTSFS